LEVVFDIGAIVFLYFKHKNLENFSKKSVASNDTAHLLLKNLWPIMMEMEGMPARYMFVDLDLRAL